MKNRARLAGHPIHPMLITIPVAAFPIALVFDVVYLFSDNPFWYAMAFWLMIVGIVGALAAAVPGIIDYLTSVPAEAMPTARRHGMINGAVVVWYVANVVVRATGPMVGPRVGISMLMSLAGVATLLYAGWLGGSLVYKYRVGVVEAPVQPAKDRPEAPDIEERRVA
jgi:uncharacterized membrane protein